MSASSSAKVDTFENVFSALFHTERLTHVEDDSGLRVDALLRYLHRAISGIDHPFAAPTIPVDLNDVLASQDFSGGVEPRIGRKYIGVLAIDSFPQLSFPGILRDLDALPIDYRWHTRAILLDSHEAQGLLDRSEEHTSELQSLRHL